MYLLFICFFYFNPLSLFAQTPIPGAENITQYLPLLQGRKVALIINQTSRIRNTLLADTLQKRGVNLVKIFVPEHGFRGTANAGADIGNSMDSETRLPVISLYGDNKKPKPSQLEDVDVVIYDLQDVGVRFFTYISTLQYAMEACAEQHKKFIVLDRPNPNGSYVDGPILDPALKSFVGMQPIPIVYGMTPGEYAKMLKGEGWFNKANQLDLKIISCTNWDHKSSYSLPVPPSPNLRTTTSVSLYPSLCLFEGTVISVGRGTNKPFMQWGHPMLEGISNDGRFSPKGFGKRSKGLDSFRPASVIGATNPPYQGKTCYGRDLSSMENNNRIVQPAFTIGWLLEAYQLFPEKSKFFNSFFEKLAGTPVLRKQIESKMDEASIRKTWQPGLEKFKKIRKKYLLYQDFE